MPVTKNVSFFEKCRVQCLNMNRRGRPTKTEKRQAAEAMLRRDETPKVVACSVGLSLSTIYEVWRGLKKEAAATSGPGVDGGKETPAPAAEECTGC